MSRLIALLITVSIACAAVADENRSDKQAANTDNQPTSFWMEKKMEHSQEILRGLAMGDFEKIRLGAAQLGLLNRVEGFIRNRNPEYRMHVHTFQRAADEIFRQSERQNLEGATLAFNQLTVSCVKCHQSLRDSDVVGAADVRP